MNDFILQALLHPVPDYYCEVRQEIGSIARPGYAISDLVMLIVALFIFTKYGGRWSGRLVGLAMIFMSIFSFLYDFHQNQLSRLLDHFGIFNVFIVFILLNLSLLISRRKVYVTAVLLFTFTYVTAFTNALIQGALLQPIFIVLLTSLLLIEYEVYRRLRPVYEKRLWYTAATLLLLGLVGQLVDSSSLWCAETEWGILNGRSIYHYFAAAAIYLMLMHYQRNRLKI